MTESGLQESIQALMRADAQEGRWQAIHLFSSDGMPMAGYHVHTDIPEERLLEFAFALIQARDLLKETDPASEILIRGKARMVFTFFQGLGTDLILAAVVSARKGHRRAMQNLIKSIQEMD